MLRYCTNVFQLSYQEDVLEKLLMEHLNSSSTPACVSVDMEASFCSWKKFLSLAMYFPYDLV